MSHVLILSNFSGSILVIYSLARGRYVHKFEIWGVLISVVGCVLTVTDMKAEKVDTSQ